MLNIKVADAKNATKIRETNADLRKIDQELKNAENIKPKNCDCDFGNPVAASALNETDYK